MANGEQAWPLLVGGPTAIIIGMAIWARKIFSMMPKGMFDSFDLD
jgi:hypothetical protein